MAADKKYFEKITRQIDETYIIANEARSKGYDPEETVGIPLAKNMAERVEGLVSVMAQQIINKGIPHRIKELETKFGKLDWRVALSVSLEVAQGKFCVNGRRPNQKRRRNSRSCQRCSCRLPEKKFWL